jgi:hypothetical protein
MNRHERRRVERLAKWVGVLKLPVFLEDSIWKADDAKYFKDHPQRSHRLRRMYPHELGMPDWPPPPGHEFQVLVKQVEPGARIRLPFGRNFNVEILDNEATLRALFDFAAHARGAS